MKFFKSKKNTEEKIKEATFEVLASNGFAGVSMREIAKKAQTAVGQLTYYYGTKENLIVSVIDEMINEFLNELENYMSVAEDKLSAIISFYEELFEKESKVFRILIDFVAQSLWNPAYKEKIKELFDKTIELIKEAYMQKGLDEEAAKKEAELLMAIISGKIMQNALESECETDKPKRKYRILEKGRLLFNVKAANNLL